MGKLEEASLKDTRRSKIQEAIITSIISGGRMGSDLLIKTVIDSMLGTDFSNPPLRRVEIVKSAASRLCRKGLLLFNDGHYVATKSGKKIYNDWQLSRYQIKQPRKWDGKWRVIIFDIPEKLKKIREKARAILTSAGFRRLQDSVWVYPYDCEDVIGLMKTDLGIGKYMLYLIVDKLENDRFLRMDFGLIQ